MKFSGRSLGRGFILLMVAILPRILVADDTEIYTSETPSGGGANILFILDSSGSMALSPEGVDVGADDARSRYQIMKNALLNVVGGLEGVSVGVQSYGGHQEQAKANGIKYPVTPVSEKTLKSVQDTINRFKVEGYTPIVQSLYEATHYFRGEQVDYGKAGSEQRKANPETYAGKVEAQKVRKTGFCNRTFGDCDRLSKDILDRLVSPLDLSDANCPFSFPSECFLPRDEAGKCPPGGFRQVPGSTGSNTCRYQYEDAELILDARYISPIKNECQKNYIVLLSDGAAKNGNKPGADADVVLKIDDDYGLRCSEEGIPAPGDGLCGPELTRFLATEDQSDKDGEQNVNTYVVGFSIEGEGKDYLELLAQPAAGQKGFFSANNEEELVTALKGITDEIAVSNSTLSPPAVTVDPNNGLVNLDAIFIPLFLPNKFPRWDGNLKRYRLETPDKGTPLLKDVNDKPVLDASKQVNANAQSYWSASPDGAKIPEGGAAALLDDKRVLYTQDENNKLLPITRDKIKSAWLGIEGADDEEALKAELVDYLQGKNLGPGAVPADGETAVKHMGDILHSRPAIVAYGKTLKDIVVFVGSNEGYLHAIRASDGHELFAFMPRELLKNTRTLYTNKLTADHPYGLDGWMSVWKNEEHTYLYVGMRRGGNNYYAMDVTDIENPRLLWTIKGGQGDFKQLAQTWSKPIVTQVELQVDGDIALHDVLVFSGGYDAEAYDNDIDIDAAEADADDSVPVKSVKGNAVYIVDARTGERLWWASDQSSDLNIEAMTDSIPANLRLLDLDGNGVTDRIYLVDVVGKIFRIDLPDSKSDLLPESEKKKLLSEDKAPQAKGHLLADLSVKTGVERMFYYEPDVAQVNQGTERYLSVSLGSGFRAHPLRKGEQVPQDRLYSIKDPDVLRIPGSEVAAIVEENLVNVTDELKVDPKNKGWYINLEKSAGEKALARAITFKNTVFFTTFLPSTDSGDICSSAKHAARVYAVSVFDARPVIFKDLDDEGTLENRYLELGTQDILSEVYLNVSDKNGKPVVNIFVEANYSQHLVEYPQDSLQKIFWEEDVNIRN